MILTLSGQLQSFYSGAGGLHSFGETNAMKNNHDFFPTNLRFVVKKGLQDIFGRQSYQIVLRLVYLDYREPKAPFQYLI